MPTVSALRIPSELTNPFYQIGSELQVVSQAKTAFDEVHVFSTTDYVTSISNENHVVLTPSNADVFASFLDDQNLVFDNTINLAPFKVEANVHNLSANEAVGQATTNRINSNLIIKGNGVSDGTLCVNCSGRIGLQTSTSNPISDIVHFDASFSNACGTSMNTLTVDDGGILKIGENSSKTGIFNIRSGNLKIKSGGKLVVNENSKLVIHDGANFIFEDGATIELLGNNAELVIKGKVTVGDNATLTFTGTGHMVIDQFIYDGVYNNFWDIGQNARLDLSGHSLRTLLECKSNFVPKMQNQHTFEEIKLRHGIISMHPNTSISTHAPLDLYMVTMKLASGYQTSAMHNGLQLWGQNSSILQCTFKDATIGINSEQTWATQALTLTNCQFLDNEIGLQTRGKNTVVLNGVFANNVNGGWGAYQMSNSSRLENSTFDNPYAFSGVYFEGQQGATLTATNNMFKNSETGIAIETATLIPSCNSFINLIYEGIDAVWCNLYLNEDKFNLFSNNLTSITISNGDGDVFFMENGQNTFVLGSGTNHINGYFGQGSLLHLTSPTKLDADNNSMTIITKGNYVGAPVDLLYSPQPFTGIQLSLDIPNNITSQSNCGFSINEVLDELVTLQHLVTFKTINTSSYPNINLNTALLDAVNDVSSDFTENLDLQAINKLAEILTFNLGSTTEDEDAMLEIGYKVLIKALNYSFSYGNLQINRAEPNALVDIYTVKAIAVIDYRLGLLNPAANTYNAERFRLNLDKAHVYRIGEYYDEAITQLQGSSSWATAPTHASRAAYWLCVCQAERSFLLEEITPEDFAIEQELCQSVSLNKQATTRERRLGQYIGSTNSTESLVSIYPNPANEFVTIQWLGADLGDLVCHVLDLNGKILQAATLPAGEDKIRISLPQELASGVYVVRLSNEKMSESAKLFLVR